MNEGLMDGGVGQASITVLNVNDDDANRYVLSHSFARLAWLLSRRQQGRRRFSK